MTEANFLRGGLSEAIAESSYLSHGKDQQLQRGHKQQQQSGSSQKNCCLLDGRTCRPHRFHATYAVMHVVVLLCVCRPCPFPATAYFFVPAQVDRPSHACLTQSPHPASPLHTYGWRAHLVAVQQSKGHTSVHINSSQISDPAASNQAAVFLQIWQYPVGKLSPATCY